MTYVVLAAGASRRMGFDKAFAPLHGTPPLARAAALLRGRTAVAVVPPERVADALALAPQMRIVANAEPERGMAHSLRLGLAAVAGAEDFGVVLADKPFVREDTIALLERALDGHDVAFPVRDGVAGHPVLFAARVRALVERVPDGDALSLVRDDPSLRRSAVPVDDDGAFRDLDTPEDWSAAHA